jgi:hypothetical protein
MKLILRMLNWYETDIVNVESVQSYVDMKQFDDYDKMGTILTRKKLEHSYSLLSDVGNLISAIFLDQQFSCVEGTDWRTSSSQALGFF